MPAHKRSKTQSEETDDVCESNHTITTPPKKRKKEKTLEEVRNAEIRLVAERISSTDKCCNEMGSAFFTLYFPEYQWTEFKHDHKPVIEIVGSMLDKLGHKSIDDRKISFLTEALFGPTIEDIINHCKAMMAAVGSFPTEHDRSISSLVLITKMVAAWLGAQFTGRHKARGSAIISPRVFYDGKKQKITKNTFFQNLQLIQTMAHELGIQVANPLFGIPKKDSTLTAKEITIDCLKAMNHQLTILLHNSLRITNHKPMKSNGSTQTHSQSHFTQSNTQSHIHGSPLVFSADSPVSSSDDSVMPPSFTSDTSNEPTLAQLYPTLGNLGLSNYPSPISLSTNTNSTSSGSGSYQEKVKFDKLPLPFPALSMDVHLQTPKFESNESYSYQSLAEQQPRLSIGNSYPNQMPPILGMPQILEPMPELPMPDLPMPMAPFIPNTALSQSEGYNNSTSSAMPPPTVETLSGLNNLLIVEMHRLRKELQDSKHKVSTLEEHNSTLQIKIFEVQHLMHSTDVGGF